MISNRIFNVFRTVFIFIFIFGMAFPGGSPVLAQDETPPDVPTEVSTSPAPAADSTGAPAVPEAQPTTVPETQPSDAPAVSPEVIFPTATPTAEPTATPATDPVETQVQPTPTVAAEPTATAVPEQTDEEKAQKVADAVNALQSSGSVLTDENGNPLSLASQTSEDILSGADDPWYEISGVRYGFTTPGGSCVGGVDASHCTHHPNPIQAAVDAAPTGTVINIVGADYSSTTVNLSKVVTLVGGYFNFLNNWKTTSNSSSKVTIGTVNLEVDISNWQNIFVNTVNVLNSSAKIQDAIDIANTGGTVNVSSGTYNENLTIDKKLALNGNPGDTTQAGAASNAPVLTGSGTGISINADQVKIKGFIIKGYEKGVSINNQNETEISNNSFVNNTLYDVYLNGHSGTKITNNSFTDPASSDGRPIGYALYIGSNTNASDGDHVIATGNFWGGCSTISGATYCGPVGYNADWDFLQGSHIDPMTFYNFTNHTWIPAGGSGTTQQGIVFNNWGYELVDWHSVPGERIDLGSPSSSYECGSNQYWDVNACANKTNPSLAINNLIVTYNGSAQAAEVVGSVSGTVSNIKYNGSTDMPTDAGTYAVSADFTPSDDTRYNSLAGASAGDFTIEKAKQTVSFTSSEPGDAKVGDTYTPLATATSNLPVTITTETSSVCSITDGVVTFITSGTCILNANQGGNTNYNAADMVQQSISVSKTAITITASSATMTYGAPVPSISPIFSSNVTTSPSITCATDAKTNSNVGSYPSYCNGPDSDGKYTYTYTPGSVNVAPAGLTVSAENKTKVYGEANPAFTVSYSGFVNGDTAANLGGTLVFDTSATVASPVGTYDVTPKGLTSSNYAITFNKGTLTITTKALTVTADAQTKVYGDPDPVLTYHITSGSLVNGDTFTGGLARVAGEDVGSYAIQQGSLALSSNYTLTFNGAQLTITKAPLTITASNAKMYVGSGQGVTIVPLYTGFKLGDTAASLTAQPVCSSPVWKTTPVGLYSSSCSGAASPNYDLHYVNGTVRVIAKPVLLPGTPAGIIPVTGGALTGLSCTSGTTLELSNGNRAIFNNPMCDFSASLTELQESDLPARLASGSFASGMTVSLSQDKDQQAIELLPSGTTLTLLLKLPADAQSKKFDIIYWDPKAKNGAGDWLALPLEKADANGRRTIGGVTPTADGYLQVTLNFTGSFVLVAQ